MKKEVRDAFLAIVGTLDPNNPMSIRNVIYPKVLDVLGWEQGSQGATQNKRCRIFVTLESVLRDEMQLKYLTNPSRGYIQMTPTGREKYRIDVAKEKPSWEDDSLPPVNVPLPEAELVDLSDLSIIVPDLTVSEVIPSEFVKTTIASTKCYGGIDPADPECRTCFLRIMCLNAAVQSFKRSKRKKETPKSSEFVEGPLRNEATCHACDITIGKGEMARIPRNTEMDEIYHTYCYG